MFFTAFGLLGNTGRVGVAAHPVQAGRAAAGDDKASREQSELNKQLFDEITNFLKEYNKEKGFSIVLSTQLGGNVLYAEDGFDITKEIVDRLNANYKKGDSQK